MVQKKVDHLRKVRKDVGVSMANKKSGSGTSDTRHPYHEYKPEKKEYYRQLELPIKLAKMHKRTNNNVNET
jgi:hypothetical protein